MRTVVLRSLAGFVAVLFAVVPFVDPNQRLADVAWTMWPLALIFGLYAAFGPRPAEWVMTWVFGTTPDTKYEQKDVPRRPPPTP